MPAATLIAVLCASLMLSACTQRFSRAIGCFQDPACAVQLGMSEEAFLAALSPASGTPVVGKAPDRFKRGNGEYVIHYVPVARSPHTFGSDGDYTPYTFLDGRLVAVGADYTPGRVSLAGDANSPALDTAQGESTADPLPDTTDPTREYRPRGPFKWCVPTLYPNGDCGTGPCC
jgi:hypothetical protein